MGTDIHIPIPTDTPARQHIHSSHNTRSNPNPHQLTTSTHPQSSTAPGSQPTASASPQPTRVSRQVRIDASTPTPLPLPRSSELIPIQKFHPTSSFPIHPTPSDYQHDSQPVVPSPRDASWDETTGHNSIEVSSRVAPVVISPPSLPWNSDAKTNEGGSSTYYVGTILAQPKHMHPDRSPASASSNSLSTVPPERRDPGFLPPLRPHKPLLPGMYNRMVRYGYWNRRGDYLTTGKYIVYAPPDRMYPLELENYPHSMEGYKDHHGNFIKYDPTHKKLL